MIHTIFMILVRVLTCLSVAQTIHKTAVLSLGKKSASSKLALGLAALRLAAFAVFKPGEASMVPSMHYGELSLRVSAPQGRLGGKSTKTFTKISRISISLRLRVTRSYLQLSNERTQHSLTLRLGSKGWVPTSTPRGASRAASTPRSTECLPFDPASNTQAGILVTTTPTGRVERDGSRPETREGSGYGVIGPDLLDDGSKPG